MSFSRDLKDFASAFATGYRIVESPVEMAYQRARTEKLRNENAAFDPELERAFRRSQVEANQALAARRRRPAVATRGRSGMEYMTPEMEAAHAAGLDDYAEGVAFENGGAVPSYRYGGWVDEDWIDRPAGQATQRVSPPEPAQVAPSAIPSRAAPVPEAAPVEPEARQEAPRPSPPPPNFTATALEAAKAGIEEARVQVGLDGAVDTPDAARRTEALQKGINSVDPKQLEEVDAAISQGTGTDMSQMPVSQKNMMRLAYSYDFYTKNNMPKRAKAAAADLLQTYRLIHNRYIAIAQTAANEGDVDGAVDAALRAYAYIPDGRQVDIDKTEDGYAFSYTDEETGKTISEALLSPDEILQAVTKHGMNSFDDLVLASGDKEGLKRMAEDRAEERRIDGENRADKRAVAAYDKRQQDALAKEVRAREQAAAVRDEKNKRDDKKDLKKLRKDILTNFMGLSEEEPIKVIDPEELSVIPAGRFIELPNGKVMKKKGGVAQAN